jgi:orotidine-5'-phosphate decarboxylase
MGKTQWSPFSIRNKHTIMLALTSNEGAFDFQTTVDETRGETEQSELKII